ncbi:MAG: hypothetical protein V9G09_09090 [Candidatus Nanopelagicales bacterium]
MVVVAIVLANIVTGGVTATALALSILLGWAIGLAMRYALGTPTTRPSGLAVATALEEVGYPVTVLRAHREFSAGRRYVATTRARQTLDVLVLDRDLEGAGVAASIWRTLRVRDDSAPSRLSMRRRLERTALQAYASQAAGAPTPELLAAVQVDEDAVLLAFPRIDGRTFEQIGDELTDADLDKAWRAVRTLHDRGITHRTLTAANLVRDDDGTVWLLNAEEGAIAASDIAARVDLAELLCTLSLLIGTRPRSRRPVSASSGPCGWPRRWGSCSRSPCRAPPAGPSANAATCWCTCAICCSRCPRTRIPNRWNSSDCARRMSVHRGRRDRRRLHPAQPTRPGEPGDSGRGCIVELGAGGTGVVCI